jgi:hypothetical protein
MLSTELPSDVEVGCAGHREDSVLAFSISRANFLHYAMRRFDGSLHPSIPAGRMTLARMASDAGLRQEILKDVAHAVANSVSATV